MVCADDVACGHCDKTDVALLHEGLLLLLNYAYMKYALYKQLVHLHNYIK